MNDQDLGEPGDLNMTRDPAFWSVLNIRQPHSLRRFLRVNFQRFPHPIDFRLYNFLLLLRLCKGKFFFKGLNGVVQTTSVTFVVVNVLCLEVRVKAFVQRRYALLRDHQIQHNEARRSRLGDETAVQAFNSSFRLTFERETFLFLCYPLVCRKEWHKKFRCRS